MNRGVTQQVVARIDQGGADRWWRPSDFIDVIGDSHSIDRALARMAQSGHLRRVRRGLYWRGRNTRFGMTSPDEIDMVSHLAGTSGVGPSGIAAANDLGLTTQVPGRMTVAVPRRAPRSLSSVRFVDRSGRVGRVANDLNWMEVALLEVLGNWDQVVEVTPELARQKIDGFVRAGDIRVDRLRAAAQHEPASVVRRLSDLLSAVDPATDGSHGVANDAISLGVQ